MEKIKIENLHFSYDSAEEEVLKGINMAFDERSTAIIGQNGAGKTTFVKLLKGLLKPTKGNVFINGVNTKATTAAKLSKYIGLVFQNPNDQIFKGKVIDEVKFGPINIGLSEKEAVERSLEALEMVGLSDKINENPYDLDLAERKLISIASIIAMDTEVIIFDEPTIIMVIPSLLRLCMDLNTSSEPIVSTPINIGFYGGTTGIWLGDVVYAYLVAHSTPAFIASFIDEFLIDIPDKIAVAVISFLIFRNLPKKMLILFNSDNKVEEL